MRFRKTVIATSLALSVAATAGVVAAQSNNPDAPGNPNIYAAVLALRADLTTAVTQLFQTLQNIQTALTNLQTPTQIKFRASPPITIGDDQGILCNVSNVSSAVRTVRVDLILPSGQPRNNDDFFTITLDPGASSAGSVGLARGTYYCKFTVVGEGTRVDIRGSTEQLTAPQPGTGSTIGAVIPAE